MPIRSSLLLFLVVSVTACSLFEELDTAESPEWDPLFAVPLVNTNITTSDLLEGLDEEALLEVEPDGGIALLYDGGWQSIEVGPLVEIPDLTIPLFQNRLSAPFPLRELQMIQLKAGQFRAELVSAYAEPIRVRLRFRNADSMGQVFDKEIIAQPGVQINQVYSLAGYDLDCSSGSIDLAYDAFLLSTGEEVAVNNLLVSIENLEYQCVMGSLSSVALSLPPDSILLGLYEDVIDGEIRFAAAEARFSIRHNAGTPLELVIERLQAYSQQNGTLALESPLLTQSLPLTYVSMAEKGSYSDTELVLNEENSNIQDLLSANPYAIGYAFGVRSLSGGTRESFLLDSTNVALRLNLRLPMHGSIRNMAVSDTIEASLDELDLAEAANFKLLTESRFPIDVQVQLYFLDARDQLIDSLYATPALLLAAAKVDGSGRVMDAETYAHEVGMEAGRFKAVLETKKLVLQTRFSSLNEGTSSVKFYEDYDVKVRIGAEVQF